MNLNIMMDASKLYIDPFHPEYPLMKRDFSGSARFKTRTERPPKYYFIDFGLSRRYDASVLNPLEYPVLGGDKQVPEFQDSGRDRPYNPFPTDVFYIGNAIKQDFLDVSLLFIMKHKSDILQFKCGFEFMQPLISDMVQTDPSKRPTMDEVVERFETIRLSLGKWKLRSRVVDTDQSKLEGIFSAAWHWLRQFEFVMRRLPAIPRPPS